VKRVEWLQNFKWEVKESIPLSHGGDALQRSPSKSKRQPASRHEMDVVDDNDKAEVLTDGGSISSRKTSVQSELTNNSMSSTPIPRRSSAQSEPIDVQDKDHHLHQTVGERHDEMPEPGLARSLLAKFQSMQQSQY
jgi:hypothetical protein